MNGCAIPSNERTWSDNPHDPLRRFQPNQSIMTGRNRIDPPPSLPAAIGVIPLATIAAAPPPDPLRFSQDSPHFEQAHREVASLTVLNQIPRYLYVP